MFTLISDKKLQALLKEKAERDRIRENEQLQKQNIAHINHLEETVNQLNSQLIKKHALTEAEIKRRVNSVISSLLKKYYSPELGVGLGSYQYQAQQQAYFASQVIYR